MLLRCWQTKCLLVFGSDTICGRKNYGFLLNGLFVAKACLLVKECDLGERKAFV
jgi:hypothetical protein